MTVHSPTVLPLSPFSWIPYESDGKKRPTSSGWLLRLLGKGYEDFGFKAFAISAVHILSIGAISGPRGNESDADEPDDRSSAMLYFFCGC